VLTGRELPKEAVQGNAKGVAQLETWAFTVKVIVDRKAIGAWTLEDVIGEIVQVENVVRHERLAG
jgi:hypothetical protein